MYSSTELLSCLTAHQYNTEHFLLQHNFGSQLLSAPGGSPGEKSEVSLETYAAQLKLCRLTEAEDLAPLRSVLTTPQHFWGQFLIKPAKKTRTLFFRDSLP